ncbi:MAG TPA: efflux RND transporter periplasmic adaptor subunit, partial [Marinagarivorans sp.]|nr:efflux RND transporter periplasmic adaptor subunit [Marinagarivorans sp.]
APTEIARPVRTLVVAANQQQLAAEYAGTIVARVESALAFQVGGKIQARHVEVGSQVKTGQLLMSLDNQDLKLGLTQAQANARTAQTQFEVAALEYKRFSDLLKTGAISQSAVDAKNVAFAAAKAYLEQAQAIEREQANQTRYAQLIANVDGVVTALHGEIGQVVAPGVPVVQLAKLSGDNTHAGPSDLELAIAIPENNLGLINKADAIDIQLWASTKEVFHGRIREIAPAADPISRAFAAKISFIDMSDAQRALLKLGMSAAAKFHLTTPQAFIKLPLSALFNNQGKTQVWQVVQGRAELTEIKVAGISGNDVLVEGLHPGQTIITAGVHVLTPGQAVSLLPALAQTQQTPARLSAQALMAPAAEHTQSNGAVSQ